MIESMICEYDLYYCVVVYEDNKFRLLWGKGG